MVKRSPLAQEYQRELSKFDEYSRQLNGLEKISTTLLRKISSILRLLENIDDDNNNDNDDTEDKYEYLPPLISMDAIKFIPDLKEYNDKIIKICSNYDNINNNSNDNDINNIESLPDDILQSLDFINRTALLHKDLEK